MYTQHGTLADVYTLLTDDDSPQPIAGSRDDESVRLTIQWMRENSRDPNDLVAEWLDRYGTDEQVLAAIAQFASTLPGE